MVIINYLDVLILIAVGLFVIIFSVAYVIQKVKTAWNNFKAKFIGN